MIAPIRSMIGRTCSLRGTPMPVSGIRNIQRWLLAFALAATVASEAATAPTETDVSKLELERDEFTDEFTDAVSHQLSCRTTPWSAKRRRQHSGRIDSATPRRLRPLHSLFPAGDSQAAARRSGCPVHRHPSLTRQPERGSPRSGYRDRKAGTYWRGSHQLRLPFVRRHLRMARRGPTSAQPESLHPRRVLQAVLRRQARD